MKDKDKGAKPPDELTPKSADAKLEKEGIVFMADEKNKDQGTPPEENTPSLEDFDREKRKDTGDESDDQSKEAEEASRARKQALREELTKLGLGPETSEVVVDADKIIKQTDSLLNERSGRLQEIASALKGTRQDIGELLRIMKLQGGDESMAAIYQTGINAFELNNQIKEFSSLEITNKIINKLGLGKISDESELDKLIEEEIISSLKSKLASLEGLGKIQNSEISVADWLAPQLELIANYILDNSGNVVIEKGIGETDKEALSRQKIFAEKTKTLTILLNKVLKLEGLNKTEAIELKKLLFEVMVDGVGSKDGKKVLLKDFFSKYEGIESERNPSSLEELASYIMHREKDDFKTGGKYELLDKEGNIRHENFVTWIRSKILYQHDLSPDSEIDLFSQIAIYKTYRTINFLEMIIDPRYFMKRKIIDVYDSEGRYLGKKVENKQDDQYEKLRDHLLYEVWLFQMSHNYNAKYKIIAGQEKKVPETLAEIYALSVFTKYRDRLLKVLSLSSRKEPEGLLNILNQSNTEGTEESLDLANYENKYRGKVGKAIRRSILAYYHLGEVGATDEQLSNTKNMFEAVLGEEGSKEFYLSILIQLFNKLYSKEESEHRIKKLKQESYALEDLKRKTKEELFKYFGGEVKEEEALNELNIFSKVNKDQSIIDWVRKALQVSVSKVEKIDPEEEVDIEYAENWAYSMVHWTGIAARNDTNGIGFDAWSKIINTKTYRRRQIDRGRSIHGDIFNIFGIKRLGLTFWEGLKVSTDEKGERKTPLIEVLQGGAGDEINLDEDLKSFEFSQHAMRQFAANHILNAWGVYDFLMRSHGFHFEKLVHKHGFEIVINHEELDKVISGIWKNIRYTYDLEEFNWDAKLRHWDKVNDSQNPEGLGKLIFKSDSLRDVMFNEEITNPDKLDMFSNHEQFKKRKTKDMGRNVFAFLIAKDILAHRTWGSGYEYWDMQSIAGVRQLLGHIVTNIKEEATKDGKTVTATDSMFNKKEMDQILKMGHAKLSSLKKEEYGFGILGTILFALMAVLKDTVKSIIKNK